MALFGRDSRRVLLGAGIGAAAVAVLPAALPALSAALRPFLKAALTRITLSAARAREQLAILGENVDDLLAEVKAEVQTELERQRGRAPRRGALASEAAPVVEEGGRQSGDGAARRRGRA